MLIRPALLAFLVAVLPLRAETFRFPTARHGDAELKYAGKIPVLHVGGTPEQIGTAVGKLALKPAERVLKYPRELCDLRGVGVLWSVCLGAGRAMAKEFPNDFRQEMDALIGSTKADRDLVIAGNTFFDIKKVFACSAVMIEKERSATGGPLLGRNLDYPSLGYIHEYTLLTVCRPKDRLAFVSVGFPGLLGVLSGMNEAGLALGVLEVFDMKKGDPYYDGKGLPYMMCLRRVLEEARTIGEAKKVLEKLRRTTTINVAIADRKEVAVFEVSPKHVIQRKPEAGVCVTTNHFVSPELKADDAFNVTRTFDRFERLQEVRRIGEKVKPDDLRRHLHAVNLGTQTLQTMVFEPATLRLHLAVGQLPASKGELATIDLADWLRPAEKRR